MQEHMRIGLLDPRWREQRDRSIRDRQTEDEVYAPGLDIESSLKQLAERRTDIFGVEETAIGKKIGEEEIQKPEEKVGTVFLHPNGGSKDRRLVCEYYVKPFGATVF